MPVRKRTAQACAQQFDRAVQAYVDTTNARDAAGFAALLDDGVTIIFGTGDTTVGKPEAVVFINDFFGDPGWTQSFRTVHTYVAACRTAFVLFDSNYAVPAQNVSKHFLIGVSWTWERGRWLVMHNQDSEIRA